MDIRCVLSCVLLSMICEFVLSARKEQAGDGRSGEGRMGDGRTGEGRQTSRLFSKLLGADYNKDVRPAGKRKKPLVVSFRPSLVEILQLDEDTGHMQMHMWMRMIWQDPSLTWNPDDFGGVEEIHVPARDVWLPDVVLYNGFESRSNRDLDVVVGRDGTVLWMSPTIYKLTCKHEFRGNAWVCPMRFASWTYDGSQLDIQPLGSEVAIGATEYISADTFEVLSAAGARVEHQYDCCTETYPAIEYVLRLRDHRLGSIRTGSLGRK